MWPRISARWGLTLALIMVAGVLALGWLVIVKTQGRDTLAATASLRAAHATDLTRTLTRSGYESDGVEVDAILATPTFFQLTNRTKEGAQLGADRALVFVANENVHYGELPARFSPILRVDGGSVHTPSEVRVLTDAVHHRTNVVVFRDLAPDITDKTHTLELLLPQTAGGTRTALQWYTPVEYPTSVKQPQGLSLGLLLALAAGLLATISPCLLQLTAYYLPTLAGVSVDAAHGGTVSVKERRRVLTTAVLFILGFTIPYTIGGAVMGSIGQAVSATGILTPTGPLAVGAGAVMILMALLVAYRSRAPMVCRIPLPAAIQRSQRLPFVETFVSGFAIATGCLACFGGAVMGVLLVYTGLLGSAALGALSMLLFSLGIAIPFMLSALGIAWVAPLALKFQRLAPAIGLVSAIVMLFFGVTMVTGNFHVVSGWLYRALPLG